MGFRFRRSVKVFPGLRLNFGKRGISASIGVRGAHVTYGPSGTRTTVGLPGSGLSYTHLEKRHQQSRALPAAAEPPQNPAAAGSAKRGFLWMGVPVAGILFAINNRLTTPAPRGPLSATAPVVAHATAPTADQGAREILLENQRAAQGLAQIRNAVANSHTLKVARVTAMPDGAICYQVHLRNSHGAAYLRTAVVTGAVLTVSGSDGFPILWNRVCAHHGGRDVTSAVEKLTF
jgi:hypothetical protein